MINKSDLEFIKQQFNWSIMRMTELDIKHWGSYEIKLKRIKETEERQRQILSKLEADLL